MLERLSIQRSGGSDKTLNSLGEWGSCDVPPCPCSEIKELLQDAIHLCGVSAAVTAVGYVVVLQDFVRFVNDKPVPLKMLEEWGVLCEGVRAAFHLESEADGISETNTIGSAR